MRKDIKNVAQYEATKRTLHELIKTIQLEMLPIMQGWTEISDNVGSTMITFCDPKSSTDAEYYYGTEAGMYCLGIPGEYFIYLPKVTVAYNEFYDAMAKLYEDDDNIFEESIFSDIDFFHTDESKIKIQLMSYTTDVDNDELMNSNRKVAKDLEDMLADYEQCSKFTYYEGDDEGRIYNPDEVLPVNYYFGVEANYDFYKIK